MDKTEALLRVVIDGQAFLYAQYYGLVSELMGRDATDEEMEQWQDEWKDEAANLVEQLLEKDSDGL